MSASYRATERFFDDFCGMQTVAGGGPWTKADTSANGTPTLTGVTGVTSSIKGALDNTNEAQNLCLYFGDICCFKANDLQTVTFRLKTGANITTAEELTFGMTSGRNDTTDSTTYNAQFKFAAANSLLVETDDNSTNDDDNDTGIDGSTSFREYVIDFTQGLADVRFYCTNDAGELQRMLPATTFACTGMDGQYLQPNIQLQKTGGTTTPSFTLDFVEILYRRS